MQEWQQRVLDEKKALDEKISKLETFCASAHFAVLDPYDRSLLTTQLGAMVEYSAALARRIARFGPA